MPVNIPAFGMYGQIANRVAHNPKCDGCLHYLKNQSACEIGLNPAICGDGTHPIQGYAPVDSTGPDPDFVERPYPGLAEGAGAPAIDSGQRDIAMATAHFGDASELLALSQQVIGDLVKAGKEGCIRHEVIAGQSNLYAGVHLGTVDCTCEEVGVRYATRMVWKSMDARLRSKTSLASLEKFIVTNKLL